MGEFDGFSYSDECGDSGTFGDSEDLLQLVILVNCKFVVFGKSGNSAEFKKNLVNLVILVNL